MSGGNGTPARHYSNHYVEEGEIAECGAQSASLGGMGDNYSNSNNPLNPAAAVRRPMYAPPVRARSLEPSHGHVRAGWADYRMGGVYERDFRDYDHPPPLRPHERDLMREYEASRQQPPPRDYSREWDFRNVPPESEMRDYEMSQRGVFYPREIGRESWGFIPPRQTYIPRGPPPSPGLEMQQRDYPGRFGGYPRGSAMDHSGVPPLRREDLRGGIPFPDPREPPPGHAKAAWPMRFSDVSERGRRPLSFQERPSMERSKAEVPMSRFSAKDDGRLSYTPGVAVSNSFDESSICMAPVSTDDVSALNSPIKDELSRSLPAPSPALPVVKPIYNEKTLAASDPGTYLSSVPMPRTPEEPPQQRSPRPPIRAVRSVDGLEKVGTVLPDPPIPYHVAQPLLAKDDINPIQSLKESPVKSQIIKFAPLMKSSSSPSVETLLAAEPSQTVLLKVPSDPPIDPLFPADDLDLEVKSLSPVQLPSVSSISSRRKSKAWGQGFSLARATTTETVKPPENISSVTISFPEEEGKIETVAPAEGEMKAVIASEIPLETTTKLDTEVILPPKVDAAVEDAKPVLQEVDKAPVEGHDVRDSPQSSSTDLFDSSSSSESESEREPEPVKVLTQKRKLGRPPLNKSPMVKEKVITPTVVDVDSVSTDSDNEEAAKKRARLTEMATALVTVVVEEDIPRKKRGRPAAVQSNTLDKSLAPKATLKGADKPTVPPAHPPLVALTERPVGGRGGRGRGSGFLGSGRGRGRKSNGLSSLGKEGKPLSLREQRRSRERALLPAVFSTQKDIHCAFTAINYMCTITQAGVNMNYRLMKTEDTALKKHMNKLPMPLTSEIAVCLDILEAKSFSVWRHLAELNREENVISRLMCATPANPMVQLSDEEQATVRNAVDDIVTGVLERCCPSTAFTSPASAPTVSSLRMLRLVADVQRKNQIRIDESYSLLSAIENIQKVKNATVPSLEVIAVRNQESMARIRPIVTAEVRRRKLSKRLAWEILGDRYLKGKQRADAAEESLRSAEEEEELRLRGGSRGGVISSRYSSRIGSSNLGRGDVIRSEYDSDRLLHQLMLKESMEVRMERGKVEPPDLEHPWQDPDFTKPLMPADQVDLSEGPLPLYIPRPPNVFDLSGSRLTLDGKRQTCSMTALHDACPRGCNCARQLDIDSRRERVWTDVEKCIFVDKFLQFPKNFPKIASFLTNRTTKDCIKFYYDSKAKIQFKSLLREFDNRRKNQRLAWTFSVAAADSVGGGVFLSDDVQEREPIVEIPRDDSCYQSCLLHPPFLQRVFRYANENGNPVLVKPLVERRLKPLARKVHALETQSNSQVMVDLEPPELTRVKSSRVEVVSMAGAGRGRGMGGGRGRGRGRGRWSRVGRKKDDDANGEEELQLDDDPAVEDVVVAADCEEGAEGPTAAEDDALANIDECVVESEVFNEALKLASYDDVLDSPIKTGIGIVEEDKDDNLMDDGADDDISTSSQTSCRSSSDALNESALKGCEEKNAFNSETVECDEDHEEELVEEEGTRIHDESGASNDEAQRLAGPSPLLIISEANLSSELEGVLANKPGALETSSLELLKLYQADVDEDGVDGEKPLIAKAE